MPFVPPEILQIVARHLTTHDLALLTRVCHAWNHIVTPDLWRSLSIKDPGPVWEESAFYEMAPAKFRRFKDAVEGTDVLVRNGHYIRKVESPFFGVVVLLAEHAGLCTGLRELRIGSDMEPNGIEYQQRINTFTTYRPLPSSPPPPLPAIPLVALVRLLRHNNNLQRLSLSGRLTDQKSPNWIYVLHSIPESVQVLEFRDTVPKGTRLPEPEEVSLLETLRPGPPRGIPQLSNLKRLAFFRVPLDQARDTWKSVMSRSKNLEALQIQYAGLLRRAMEIAATLRLHCPRLVELHLLSYSGHTDEAMQTLLGATTFGWRTLGLPYTPKLNSVVGPAVAAKMLDHASTLENVRLDGYPALSSEFLQRLLCSAPNLKRFDVIARDRSYWNERGLNAEHIVSSSQDWVCLFLESFKCRIGNIPRPDVTKRTNGRPFSNDDPMHSGSMEDSRAVQRAIYRQLGRLTKLKTLILGRDDVDYDQDVEMYESYSEGEYFGGGSTVQAGYQYECLDMTIESGMDLMGGLKDLRHLELDAMAVGVDLKAWIGAEGDLVWMKENWPKLGEKYEDTFWTDLGYDEYY